MIRHTDHYQLLGPRTPFPSRSVLVRLQPLGLGTPYLESLSSYYQRLADAHALTPQVLARELIFADITKATPKRTYHFEDAWRLPSFNGLAAKDGEWVQRLMTLTSQRGLEDLTMGFLAPYVSTRGLVAKRPKWCPACIGEGAAESTPYGQLLWSFKAVTCCPKHKVNLVSSCGCPRSEWKPSGRIKCLPHVCPRCAGNLGRYDHPKASKPSAKKLLHACMVAELLVSDRSCWTAHPEKSVPTFLRNSIQTYLEGNAIKLAGILGVTKSTLSGWMSGKHRPDFSRILQIAELHGCTLEDVLLGRSEEAKHPYPTRNERSGRQPSRQNPGEINWRQVVISLKEALTAEPPQTLSALAAQVGVSADTLRNRESELCSEISKRWQSRRESCTGQRKLIHAQQVRMEASRIAREGQRPTWQRLVEKDLPIVPIWRWRSFVQTICDEVWHEEKGSQRAAEYT